MVDTLLDTGLCSRTVYFIPKRGFRNSVSGSSKICVYIYKYLALFCIMDILIHPSGSVSLLIIGTSSNKLSAVITEIKVV